MEKSQCPETLHTGFNSGVFTVGAVGAAATLAGAMVGTLQAAAQLNARRWDGWTRDQLVTAANLSEALKNDLREKVDELTAENARLRAVVKSLTIQPSRASRR